MPFRRDEVTGRVSAQGHAYANWDDAQINNDIHGFHFFTMMLETFCFACPFVATFSNNMGKQPKSKTAAGQSAFPPQQPTGFSNLDIGSPQLAGSAKQLEDGWDLVAGKVDIWEKSDQFHYVQKQIADQLEFHHPWSSAQLRGRCKGDQLGGRTVFPGVGDA
jgi:hypothetical protein